VAFVQLQTSCDVAREEDDRMLGYQPQRLHVPSRPPNQRRAHGGAESSPGSTPGVGNTAGIVDSDPEIVGVVRSWCR